MKCLENTPVIHILVPRTTNLERLDGHMLWKLKACCCLDHFILDKSKQRPGYCLWQKASSL